MSIDLHFSRCQAGETSSFLVRSYFSLNSNTDTGCYSDKHIPEGSCTLVFNFEGEVNMSIGHLPALKLPPYFLTLPYLGFVNIKVTLPSDTFGVVCKASVFSAFFNIPLNATQTLSFRTIDDVISPELYEKLKSAGTLQNRIKTFENYISRIGEEKKYDADDIDLAYEQIYSSNGLLQIKKLVTELNLNSRSFRRNFDRRVGVSAKSLCRIVRANQVLNALKESGKIDFQNIVYSGKYFDQPHFVNDFRKFVGESPGMFFHRDLRLVKLFSGLQ
jgi:AraC-like DNA-binding protein